MPCRLDSGSRTDGRPSIELDVHVFAADGVARLGQRDQRIAHAEEVLVERGVLTGQEHVMRMRRSQDNSVAVDDLHMSGLA